MNLPKHFVISSAKGNSLPTIAPEQGLSLTKEHECEMKEDGLYLDKQRLFQTPVPKDLTKVFKCLQLAAWASEITAAFGSKYDWNLKVGTKKGEPIYSASIRDKNKYHLAPFELVISDYVGEFKASAHNFSENYSSPVISQTELGNGYNSPKELAQQVRHHAAKLTGFRKAANDYLEQITDALVDNGFKAKLKPGFQDSQRIKIETPSNLYLEVKANWSQFISDQEVIPRLTIFKNRNGLAEEELASGVRSYNFLDHNTPELKKLSKFLKEIPKYLANDVAMAV